MYGKANKLEILEKNTPRVYSGTEVDILLDYLLLNVM